MRQIPFYIILSWMMLSVVSGSDWLIDSSPFKAEIAKSDSLLVLHNGLIRREILLNPNATTISFRQMTAQEEFVRSVRPEAEITVNSTKIPIGGALGQPVHNYLPDSWLSEFTSHPLTFQYDDASIGPIGERFPWEKRRAWMPIDYDWPPTGKHVSLHFLASDSLANLNPLFKNIHVYVHYNIYDGIPLICKWLSIKNQADTLVTVNRFKSEILAFVEPESYVEEPPQWMLPNMTVVTDYSFGGDKAINASVDKSVFWEIDSLYLTQVNYKRVMPCLLECKPALGPEQILHPGETFESFRTFELLHDSWERERKGLGERKMYRRIAPWSNENPILMHVRRADNESVIHAIDQCAEVGFEMVIITFGSGFNLEDHSRENLDRMKTLADYAHSKGIALGGYSLLASRSIDADNDVVLPEGLTPVFKQSPCLESQWGQNYFDKLYSFYEITGMDVLEHDGSYPGDVCASTRHPGHTGFEDSQWNQYRRISDFYKWCRSKGIYLNVPDWYFLNGSSKLPMGYRETNWSLPRKQQEIIERQNIYDGTWTKTPSMGWMFVPLTEYHGGGAAATIEPLREHLEHYEQRLANLFGAGVQACYRGPRLFDSPETKNVVKKWVDFYKQYRAILDSDIIHVRRPDGRQLDCILHVNPDLDIKGLAMVYNPTAETKNDTLRIPLYYTGLTEYATIQNREGKQVLLDLDRKYNVDIPISVEPYGVSRLIFR